METWEGQKRMLCKRGLQILRPSGTPGLVGLPESAGEEVADFADFLVKKTEEEQLQKGIQRLIDNSDAFAFLHDEEDLYTPDDLIEKYD